MDMKSSCLQRLADWSTQSTFYTLQCCGFGLQIHQSFTDGLLLSMKLLSRYAPPCNMHAAHMHIDVHVA